MAIAPVHAPPSWARAYIGLPWRAYGRSRDGVDCWGLVWLIYAERFGIALPRHDGVCETGATAAERAAARAEVSALMEAGRQDWREIPAGEEREGDVVLLRRGRRPTHVGVVVAPGLMLHVMEGIDVALESYRGLMWRDRAVGVFRYQGSGIR